MNTTVPQVRHLNEAPIPTWIFAAITANDVRGVKSVATTIARGTTLLQDGYAFVRAGHGRYIVANEGGNTYTLYIDVANHVLNCDCEAHVRHGVCKHAIALFLNQKAIDLDNDIREARERAVPEKTNLGYWEGWNAFFDEIDAKTNGMAQR